MRFRLVHEFATSLDEFERRLLDERLPDFLEQNCPGLLTVEVVACRESGSIVYRTIRFRPAPGAFKVGPKTVNTHDGELLTHLEYDRRTRTGVYRNVPDLPRWLAPRFSDRGTMTFREADGRVTRLMQGEIIVRFPVLGRIAERVIHDAGVALIEEEARGLSLFIRAGHRGGDGLDGSQSPR